MMWSRIGWFAIGTIGFGMLGAASCIRNPRLPQKSTTFIADRRLSDHRRARGLHPAQVLVDAAGVGQQLEVRQPRVHVAGEIGFLEIDLLERAAQLTRSAGRVPRSSELGKSSLELAEINAIAPRIGPGALGILDLAPRERLADDLSEIAHLVVLRFRSDVERLGPNEVGGRRK